MKMHWPIGMTLLLNVGCTPQVEQPLTLIQIQNPINIDAELNEWPDVPVFILNKRSQAVRIWTDRRDLTAKAWAGWDEDFFYFACQTRDDILVPAPQGGNLWKGDSIQLAFGMRDDDFETIPKGKDENFQEYGFALTVAGPQGWCWSGLRCDWVGQTDDIFLAVRQHEDGEGHVYEVAIPWKRLNWNRPQENRKLRFSFTVNDNDGQGFEGGLQLTSGIYYPKSSANFLPLALVVPSR